MIIYRVIHNLTANTIEQLEAEVDCKVSRYAECFPTKKEAAKYAQDIKWGLRSLTNGERYSYKRRGEDCHLTNVCATKYIKACGFKISVSKVSIKDTAELATALSAIPLQEFHSYNEDCGTTDHLECAVFQWDSDNATDRTVYGGQNRLLRIKRLLDKHGG
jgi:hypothetical protein